MAPYVDMASIVAATHKKKTNLNPVGKFNVTDACSTYISKYRRQYRGKKCANPSSLRHAAE